MLNNNLQVIIRPAKLTELSLVKNFLLEQCKILYHGAISPNQYQDLEQLQEKYFSPKSLIEEVIEPFKEKFDYTIFYIDEINDKILDKFPKFTFT